MKTLPFVTMIGLVLVSMVSVPALADKASPKLALSFRDDSDRQVDDATNLLLNDFAEASQRLLDRASPILMKLIDQSSPQLLGRDSASPRLMKQWDSATPKLLHYSGEWVSLANDIDGGAYTAEIAGTDVSKPGRAEIFSDASMTSIKSTVDLEDGTTQTIEMTYEKSTHDWSIRLGRGGGIGGILGYECYLKFDGVD